MVKCADCGFLAQRHKETRQLLDAEEGLRKKGDVPRQPIGDGPLARTSHPPFVYEHLPLCAQLQIEFPEENTIEAIQQERECPVFTPWHPGFTPKEHQEMLDRQWLLEWQAEREDDDRRIRRVEFLTTAIVAGVFTVGGVTIGALLTAILTH